MHGLFKEIEGECAIVVERGVFRQVAVAERDGYLFAKVGSGYVRLMADGSTSKANTRLDMLSFEPNGSLRQRLGRLCLEGVAGAKPLSDEKLVKLLARE